MQSSSVWTLLLTLSSLLVAWSPVVSANDLLFQTPPPTSAPTTAMEEEGEVVIVLKDVVSEMDFNLKEDYQRVISTLMLRHFQEVTGWQGVLHTWQAIVTEQTLWTPEAAAAAQQPSNDNSQRRQQRRAQQQQQQMQPQERRHVEESPSQSSQEASLRSTTTTTAEINARLLATPNEVPLVTRVTIKARMTQTLGAANFATAVQDVVDTKEAEFLVLLKDPEKLVTKVYFDPVLTTETFGPMQDITTTPKTLYTEDPDASPKSGDTGGDDDDGLNSRTIAGIAAAGGFVVVLIVGIICVVLSPDDDKKKHQGDDDDEEGGAYGDSLDNNRTSLVDRQSRSFSINDSASLASGVSSRYRSRNLGSLRSSSTRIVSSDGRTLSIVDNSSEFKDAPPEMAPARGRQASNMSDDEVTPIFEDEGGVPEEGHDDDEEYEEVYEEVQHHEASSYHEGASTQPDFSMGVSMAESEQQSHQPEAQTIPPAQAPQDDGHARQVVAPPGKLGIVIETTLEGPVVHKINDTSPLKGLVTEGELITAIDDVDTRAMSASAITSLMIRTADSHRTMTVRSSMAG